MTFRFDHLGVLTDSVDIAGSVYGALGMEVLARDHEQGSHDLAYFGAGTDVALEIMGPPLFPESQSWVDEHGWSIERIALSCDDVQREYDRLIDAGLASAWEPTPFAPGGEVMAIAAGLFTPDGLMIDIIERVNVELPAPKPRTRDDLRLHHVSYLTSDLGRDVAFWTQHFGLRCVYDFTRDNAGFVLLADEHWDPEGHDFLLEIIGGEFDSIDGPVWESRGPCYDHLCFTTSDVEGTWRRAVAAGVAPLAEPWFHPEWDATVAWLYDADGTHIELMTPIPPEAFGEATGGACTSRYVDGWKRDVPVSPRPEGKPQITV
jgi:catechol 2,3-dioxygenase-like lactoylglutathione lyase family enzyme